MSFRRQVHVLISPNMTPPDHINFTFAGTNYRVFLSTESVRCFNCGEFGHISRNCKKPQTDQGAKRSQATNTPASNRVSQEQRMSSPSRDSTTVTAPPSPSTTTTRTLPLPRQAASPAGPPQGAPPRAPPTCLPQNARLTPSRPKLDTSSRSTQQPTSPRVSLPHPSSSTRPKVPLEAKHSASALTTDPPPTDHSHTPSRSPPPVPQQVLLLYGRHLQHLLELTLMQLQNESSSHPLRL